MTRLRHSVEEVANTITHGIGLLLSIVGFVVLLVLAALRGTAWHIVACSIYGATLICLYTRAFLHPKGQESGIKSQPCASCDFGLLFPDS